MYGREKPGRGLSGRLESTNTPTVSGFSSVSPTRLGVRQHILPLQSDFAQSHPQPNLAPPAKTAIPASKRRRLTGASTSFNKQRTPHACDCCLKAKTGCNGKQPCDRCKQASEQCIYSDFKRVNDRKSVAKSDLAIYTLTCCRRVSKLSKEIEYLTQDKLNMTDALRRIQLNTKLSSNEMRTAIGRVLDKAPVLPHENGEPASDVTRASADREEYITNPVVLSSELDFFDGSFDTTTATQMLGDIGRTHGYYEDPWQHSVTTLFQGPFPFPPHDSELVHESMHISGGSGGSGGDGVIEGFGSQAGVVVFRKRRK